MIGAAVLWGVGMLVLLVMSSGASSQDKGVITIGKFILTLVIGAFVVLLTLGSMVKMVPAGHEGLVYTWNDITAQRSSGLQLIAPWQGFKEVSVQTQSIRSETNCVDKGTGAITEECLETFSIENQDVFVVATMNLRVDKDNIITLFTEYPDFIDKIVRPRFRQVIKEATVQFSSTDIAINREVLRVSVTSILAEQLAPFGINLEDVLFDNVDFPQSFKDTIEARQAAAQEAEKQVELIASAEAKAEQVIAAARGEAEANRILAESLSVNGNAILQFRAIEKLAGNITLMLLDSQNGLIPILGEGLLTGGAGNNPLAPSSSDDSDNGDGLIPDEN